MGVRQDRRTAARALRDLKVPFVLRHTLAKAQVRGARHAEVLYRKGFACVKSYGCECCDPNITQVWEGDSGGHRYRITTGWGSVD